MWPDRRIIDLFKIEFPILLAPMAGVMDADLAIAVAEGGGLAIGPDQRQLPVVAGQAQAGVDQVHRALDALQPAGVEDPQRAIGAQTGDLRGRRGWKRPPRSDGGRQQGIAVVAAVGVEDVAARPEEPVGEPELLALQLPRPLFLR